MMEAVDSCPAPLVARVQGFALGGGSGLVACADIVVAAPDATFGFTEVRLGIIPAVISPFVFAKIGTGAARRFFLTGERFDAETALRIGLVHELADDLDAAVERFVGGAAQVGAGGDASGETAGARTPVRRRGARADRSGAALRRRGTGRSARVPREARAQLAGLKRLLFLVGAIVLVDTMFYAALTPLLPHYAQELGLGRAAPACSQARTRSAPSPAESRRACSRRASASSRRS